ncbi:hypothetical protein POSPLADRAFT_1076538 [Postia placenta MAD-698-R-SB12]|uniref:GPI ethanolamine phosphate transferase 1 n=1 Tax=Postia placenta MAD-698-R-SB12 TaxID=670580 RepID=A0A1X6MJP3_9APHY|nr:hypothetical protein POSPLADRAFT_1076538 [Postia placenta MAD-698-R-SB12]OSX56657.1 hypothetical protein POSPLADRAFT_1076538 [Postia placenta MAD-698-R-SB12]
MDTNTQSGHENRKEDAQRRELTRATERKGSVFHLLLIGLIFHLVYIGTVFDCYFTSPVVRGMRPHKLDYAGSKRLVLIVADGLRADLLLALNGFATTVPDAPEVVAPHMRSVIQNRGAFGVSHTRVPTESRPGHVALIGGMYEDVSAVTRGWKTNPVDFDSVFNRSSHTFSFGSPDILPMFARGATPGRVDMWSYDEDEEDFTKDATGLDTWVLEQLRTLLHNATVDAALDATLREDKTVFFLHLLGLDTTGHSFRPHSKEYMANIQVVDEIVRQTEELFMDFFKDEETSFIFTADHGMSMIGNHGDGDPDNTRTPLIAWGRGVRGPLQDSTPSSHDVYSAPWGLSHLLRHDVEQADVAALMSALLGTEWPVNSVGVLPDVDPTRPGYLSILDGERTQAKAALVNAEVLLEHYHVKHEAKKTHSLYYRPYSYFAESKSNHPGAKELNEIEGLVREGKYSAARGASAELIRHTLAGLRYLETYDRTLIRAIVTAAYLGWMAFGAASIFAPRDAQEKGRGNGLNAVAVGVLSVFWGLFALQRSPWSFYLYICFPVYFWHQALLHGWTPMLRVLQDGESGILKAVRLAMRACLVVAALESMVAGYTHREIWSIGFVILGVVWPLLFWPNAVRNKHLRLLGAWCLACSLTAIFPLLSVYQKENLPLVWTGGLCMLLAGGAGLVMLSHEDGENGRYFWTTLFQCLVIMISVILVQNDTYSPLPHWLPVMLSRRILFAVAPAVPLFRRYRGSDAFLRILPFFLGLSVCFVILAISVEGLFFCAFSATLLLWVYVEAAFRGEAGQRPKDLSSYKPKADDLRIAVFFLFFVQVAFFGTGNVASISSFYLEPVFRVIPVFSPFIMASLLIFKIIAPYIILASCFQILNTRLGLPPFSLFLVALTITDVMTMTFFFNVTDTGSWLEIGQTISFFCISSLLLVWAAGTCAVGEILMQDSPPPSGKVPASENETSGHKVKEE